MDLSRLSGKGIEERSKHKQRERARNRKRIVASYHAPTGELPVSSQGKLKKEGNGKKKGQTYSQKSGGNEDPALSTGDRRQLFFPEIWSEQ